MAPMPPTNDPQITATVKEFMSTDGQIPDRLEQELSEAITAVASCGHQLIETTKAAVARRN